VVLLGIKEVDAGLSLADFFQPLREIIALRFEFHDQFNLSMDKHIFLWSMLDIDGFLRISRFASPKGGSTFVSK